MSFPFILFILAVAVQVPRYIITLHELLAHTPHDHVERNSLEYAKNKLEELSRVSDAAAHEADLSPEPAVCLSKSLPVLPSVFPCVMNDTYSCAYVCYRTMSLK